jgi:hypothetical protein
MAFWKNFNKSDNNINGIKEMVNIIRCIYYLKVQKLPLHLV